jgi:hypothetical protein
MAMTLSTEEAMFLQHLAQEWRKPASRKSWAFDWRQLHAFGENLGHDAAAVERIIRQLEQAGALQDKAPDWEVMGGHFVITDRGMQAALTDRKGGTYGHREVSSPAPPRAAAG